MIELRKRAEKKAVPDPKPQAALPPKRARELLHDLQVHQIELEMQNEELRASQTALEASRERYFDLYDLAPVGYLTLSRQGLILEANLTAANLLGAERGTLVRRPFMHFILLADDDIYKEHCNRLFRTGKPEVFELRLVKRDGVQFWARLEITAAKGAGDTPVCRVILSNIAEQKLAEEALNLAFNETEQKVELRTRELQRANRALLMLKECDEAMLRARSESDLFDSICRIVVEIGMAKMAWVGFPEQDEEKTVRPVAAAGDGDEYLKDIRVTWANNAHGNGPTGTAIRTGRVNICRDIANDSRLAPWRAQQLQREYASSIALPLIGGGHCFGVLTIYAAQVDAFNDEGVELLNQLAGDLAFGIIGLRTCAEQQRLQQELLIIIEREKQLIAQELHDGLCQHLSGTAMMGSLIARRMAERGDPDATQVKEVCDLLKTGVDEARNLAHGLHPVKSGGEGLVEGLLQFAKTATKLYHIHCSFLCGKSVVIESQVVATHFYRIAQEAVNNAMKHGEASRVRITLSRGRAGIGLSIRDNGIGIPKDMPPSRGMGMQIMKHRADSIGATFKAIRGARGGTVISCTLPC